MKNAYDIGKDNIPSIKTSEAEDSVYESSKISKYSRALNLCEKCEGIIWF